MLKESDLDIVLIATPDHWHALPMIAAVEAGADVFRINMSHTPHDELKRLHGVIRKIESGVGRPISIMVDLQGPKLRIGRFAGAGIALESGRAFRLDLSDEPGNFERAPLPHPEIFAAEEHASRSPPGIYHLHEY